MFSKEEAARLRQQFWVSFGKSFPRKWLLYNTKVKGFSFKFVADRKKAMVCLDIDSTDAIKNELLWDQMVALKSVIAAEYLPDVIFDDSYVLENGKRIYRMYVPLEEKFSIYNKNTWSTAYEFFVDKMTQFEFVYYEFEDFIKSAIQ